MGETERNGCEHTLVQLLVPGDVSKGSRCATCKEEVEILEGYRPHAKYRCVYTVGDNEVLSPLYEKVVRDHGYLIMVRFGEDIGKVAEALSNYGEVERVGEDVRTIWLRCTAEEEEMLVAGYEKKKPASPMASLMVVSKRKKEGS